MTTKQDLLRHRIEHVSLRAFDPVPLLEGFEHMAFQARNTARAAGIYESMLRDEGCTVVLCLAGSLVSAGLKRVFVEMIESRMVDAIVSTGANIVDQDFFEALGFHHWIGDPRLDDEMLRDLGVDRIYDTLIDEDELRVCDDTITEIADALEPRPYTSREFVFEMGRWLAENDKDAGSIVGTAFRHKLPIFCPAFSDSSAGFGLVQHQWRADVEGRPRLSIDSARDFLELTRIKIEATDTGLLMIGGGVSKNFAQDVVVAADVLGESATMHRYAVQITVADERDGACSSSTLREACSWGKVSVAEEQMVYGEATVILPLVAGWAFHRNAAAERTDRRLNRLFDRAGTSP